MSESRGRRRSNRDRVADGMLVIARRQQGHRALVIGGAAGGVDSLVQLRNGGEDQREKKQADEGGGHDRDRLAIAKMPLHCGRVCFLRVDIASRNSD